MKCRHCQKQLSYIFLDLGSSPPSNAYLTVEKLQSPEKWFPLRVLVCDICWLVQTEDFARFDELFADDYAYFSSYSSSWLEHAERYVSSMINRFKLSSDSHVIEIAANDGYLLQYVKQKAIPCIGVEPTHSTAQAAREKGIPIVESFFGTELASRMKQQGKQADLMVANNVLAHVPNINDFICGFAILLKPNGVATFEFPSLSNLVNLGQFDTIYHEHFSYLSFLSVSTLFANNGLQIFDVETIDTHGGSLRIFAQPTGTGKRAITNKVEMMLASEIEAGINSLEFYHNFQAKADQIKNDFLLFLLNAKQEGKKIAAYGAAAKGNTFLNYAGIRSDSLSFVVDRNPNKQGKFMPGSRLPIRNEEYLKQYQPDYIVILPWNLREEITKQLHYATQWGAQFVTAIPRLTITTRPNSKVMA